MEYIGLSLDQERALYGVCDSLVAGSRFDGPADGESALKEARGIKVQDSYFNLRYPFWHVTDAEVSNCQFTQNCRAAFWYDKNIVIGSSSLKGTKAIRECENLTLKNSTANSEEFIWKCRDVTIESVTVEESEYPFFEVEGAKISALTLKGKYSFQYCSDMQISDSTLDTKDAFWHSKNVTVRDCVIKSEYLGWYSENLTLVNCRIVGTQPFCYCKNLVLQNCVMESCDRSFERSTVQASVVGTIDGVKNPLGGKIEADSIKEIIMEETIVEPSKTQIICRNGSMTDAAQ